MAKGKDLSRAVKDLLVVFRRDLTSTQKSNLRMLMGFIKEKERLDLLDRVESLLDTLKEYLEYDEKVASNKDELRSRLWCTIAKFEINIKELKP